MSGGLRAGRDAALDNLKGILIISVVYVHLYDMLGQRTPLLYVIRMTILAVQMPLFLFLCGYFGKNVKKRQQEALREYLLPFLLFNTLYFTVRCGQQESLRYGLLRPLNMYWFLLTLLVIRLLLPELLKLRFLPVLAIGVALFAGLDSYFGRTLSLSRTACFLPFYLAGYYCSKEHMARIRRIPVPAALLFAAFGSFMTLLLTKIFKPDKDASHPFQLVNSYAAQGLTEGQGLVFRLAIYLVAPMLGILLLRLMPSREGLLTRIGRGSMTVYLLHAFPMLLLVGQWGIVGEWCKVLLPALTEYKYPGKLCGGVPQLCLLTAYALTVSVLCSSRPVMRVYDAVMERLRRLFFRPEDKE